MAKLTDLGFSKGIIFETIVSSFSDDGTPNAAPMGITMENNGNLTLEVFNTSLTSHNVQENKCAVINLTNQIELFYKTAFKEANPQGKLPAEWFEKASVVNAPKLCSTDGAIEVSVKSAAPLGKEKIRFQFKVMKIDAQETYPKVYSRAMSATLEAIIHATRVKAFAKEERRKKQVKKLLNLIANCNDIVNCTAPTSTFSNIMADLNRLIVSWGVKH
jgi:hypothetical protein